MRYLVDIDGTICTQQSSGEYANAKPYTHRIKQINDLYDAGNEIIYWTARGMNTGVDYTELTQQQLQLWNCKHHALWMKKPAYDVWIDDKAQWIFVDE